ncbi:MAG: GGDEF domain-containing protein [Deltaproteobacteria bacterium]|jgi:diguanylate cyclase (GGDEF)-like protein|nr:GGDEF domain-containing protein [Deltaproteobacteria bacterium]
MVEIKENQREQGADALRQRFLEAERELRRLEQEKDDYIRAIRHLINPVVLALNHEGTPDSLTELLRGFVSQLNQGIVSPLDLEVFSQNFSTYFLAKDAEGSKDILLTGRISPGACGKNDAFQEFLSQIAGFKGALYADESKSLQEDLAAGVAVSKFLNKLAGLLIRFLADSRSERREISLRLSAIIRTLVGLESEFRRFLDRGINFIGNSNRVFTGCLSERLETIQRHLAHTADEDPEKLLALIAEEVEVISTTIREKTDEDLTRLESLHSEKAALQSSLETVRRDYDAFVQQSHRILKEMEEIRAVALRDALTGVYNRRAYDEQLLLTLLNYKSGRLLSFTLIIFDIDYFRDVNNNYGHQAGDSILFHLAKIVGSTLRCDDFVFRYGGDEFVIILPGATLHDSLSVAEKIRRNVGAVEFQLTRQNEKTIRVTISVGVAAARPEDTPTSLLARADQALYASKENGRNRVTAERPESQEPEIPRPPL